MRARQLIDGASFGPDALKAIVEAFDQAWSEIAANFQDDPIAWEEARLGLAERCSRSPMRKAATSRF
jgi:hypothetical protein